MARYIIPGTSFEDDALLRALVGLAFQPPGIGDRQWTGGAIIADENSLSGDFVNAEKDAFSWISHAQSALVLLLRAGYGQDGAESGTGFLRGGVTARLVQDLQTAAPTESEAVRTAARGQQHACNNSIHVRKPPALQGMIAWRSEREVTHARYMSIEHCDLSETSLSRRLGANSLHFFFIAIIFNRNRKNHLWHFRLSSSTGY